MEDIENSTILITGYHDTASPTPAETDPKLRLCNRDLDAIFWVVYAVIGVAIVLGNTLTCVVFISSDSLRRSVMNVFLTSLAVSDILMALLIIPGFAVYCSGCVYPLTEYCWIFGGARDIVFMASVFNLLAITYDRYLAVLQPLFYLVKMTKTRVIVNLLLVWITPIFTTCLRNAWQHTNSQETVKKINTVFNNTLVFCFVITPIFLLVGVNIKIIQVIKTHRNRIHPLPSSEHTSGKENLPVPTENANEPRKREALKKRRGTLSCVFVVGMFIVCWLPRASYNFFYLSGRVDLIDPYLVKISLFFILLQSSLNPLVYSFHRAEFRIAASRLLRIR